MSSARSNAGSAQASGPVCDASFKLGDGVDWDSANLFGCHVLPDTSCASCVVHLKISSDCLYPSNATVCNEYFCRKQFWRATHRNDVLVLLYGKRPPLQVWVHILLNLEHQTRLIRTPFSTFIDAKV